MVKRDDSPADFATPESFASGGLQGLEEAGLRRHLAASDRGAGARIERHGRTLISFCCNDYLGLSQHPDVVNAARDALLKWGTGAGASRLVSGDNSLNHKLESALADFRDCEAACLFGSGYLANIGVIPVFAGARDLVLIDALAHACLHAGARLGGATVRPFGHNDMADLARLLGAERHRYRHCLIVTEGIFSMDGDRAPLPEISALAKARKAWLLVDDAHGLGVSGRGGRGSVFAFGRKLAVDLQTGTLSKAAGSYGGYVCASRPVIELIRNRARSFIYTTGLPPATLAAACEALTIIRRDSALRARPLAHARRFSGALGLKAPVSPIVPLIIGPASDAMAASAGLEERGFLVTAIRPPTVPEGTARLRFTFSAAHRSDEVTALADAVREIGLAAT